LVLSLVRPHVKARVAILANMDCVQRSVEASLRDIRELQTV